MTPILCIVGPTASGKSAYALTLAKERDAEMISADSRQVYRYLRVGTGKPQGQWIHRQYRVDGIPHHLMDIWDPAQPFSAGDFVRLAKAAIEDIRRRKKEPIVVGGTGLYLKALFEGLAPLPPRDEAVRQELQALAEKKGRRYLHGQLAQVDPKAAQRIPPNNIARVIRALEVYQLTGTPISEWHRKQRQGMGEGETLRPEYLGLAWERETLYARIDSRCRWMIESGMIEETEALLQKGCRPDCPGLQGVGYPHVVSYLQGRLSRAVLLERLTRDTRRYAKRQLTWFRHQAEVRWIRAPSTPYGPARRRALLPAGGARPGR